MAAEVCSQFAEQQCAAKLETQEDQTGRPTDEDIVNEIGDMCQITKDRGRKCNINETALKKDQLENFIEKYWILYHYELQGIAPLLKVRCHRR